MTPLKKASVLGFPIRHSLSPEIFKFLSRRLKVPLHYDKMEVKPKALRSRLTTLKRDLHVIGCNITIPHKEAAFQLCDWISPEVKITQAANVIHFRKGTAKAYNTDIDGVLGTLQEQNFRIQNQTAVLFGAGGAAQAVCYALGKKKLKTLYVVNRSFDRATQLCRKMNQKMPHTHFVALHDFPGNLDPQSLKSTTLFINSTPLGMKGFSEDDPWSGIFSDIGEVKSRRARLAFDLIYNPSKTSFMVAANQAKIRSINGLDMLLWQAIRTWEIWFGKTGPLKTNAGRKKLKQQLKSQIQRKLSQ